MDNPIEELAGVIRALTESPSTQQVFDNIDKYFTEDAAIFYPVFNQIYTRNGRENLKAAYQWRRTFTYNDRSEYNVIMVNKDQTQATIDTIQVIRFRLAPIRAFDARINYIIRLGLRRCDYDGKYRVYRQQDNFPTDITQSGIPLPHIVRIINDATKAFAWLFVVFIGHILMMLGIF